MQFRTLIALIILVCCNTTQAQVGSWVPGANFVQHSVRFDSLTQLLLTPSGDTMLSYQNYSNHGCLKRWVVSSGILIDSVTIPASNGTLAKDLMTVSVSGMMKGAEFDSVHVDVYSAADSRLLLQRHLGRYSNGYFGGVLQHAAVYDSLQSTLYAWANYHWHIPGAANDITEKYLGDIYRIVKNDTGRVYKDIGSTMSYDYSSHFNSFLSSTAYWTNFHYTNGGTDADQVTDIAVGYEITPDASKKYTVPGTLRATAANCRYACGDSLLVFSTPSVLYMRARSEADTLRKYLLPFQSSVFCIDESHTLYLVKDSGIKVYQLETMVLLDSLSLPKSIASLTMKGVDTLLALSTDGSLFKVSSRGYANSLATFSTSKRVGYIGLRIQFVHVHQSKAKKWFWTFGDGSVDSTSGPLCTHQYTKEGVYTISLKVTLRDNSVLTTTFTRGVTIVLPLLAAFRADKSTGPAPLHVQFSNQSSGEILEYSWNFDDGSTSNEPEPAHSFSAEKCHSIRLTIRDTIQSITLTHQCFIVPSPVPVTFADLSSMKSVAYHYANDGVLQEWASVISCEPFGDRQIAVMNQTNTYLKRQATHPTATYYYNHYGVYFNTVDDSLRMLLRFAGGTEEMTFSGYSAIVDNPISSLILLHDSLVMYYPFMVSYTSGGPYKAFGMHTTDTINFPSQRSVSIGSEVEPGLIALVSYIENKDSSSIAFHHYTSQTAVQRNVVISGQALRVFKQSDGAFMCLSQKNDNSKTIVLYHFDRDSLKKSLDTIHIAHKVFVRDWVQLSNGVLLVSGKTLDTPTQSWCMNITEQGSVVHETVSPRWKSFSRLRPQANATALVLCSMEDQRPTEFECLSLVNERGECLTDMRLQDSALRVLDFCTTHDGSLWLVGARYDYASGFIARMRSDSLLVLDVEQTSNALTSSSRVFPMPAQQSVTLQVVNVTDNIPLHALMYDVCGQVVYEGTAMVMNKQCVVSFTELNSGTYALMLCTQGGEIVERKLIVVSK